MNFIRPGIPGPERGAAQLLPAISTQMRGYLSNLYLASRKLYPDPGKLDPERRKWFSILNQQYFRLLRLANHLSSAAYLTGERMFRKEPFDVVGSLKALCAMSADLVGYSGVTLRFECPMRAHVCMVDMNALKLLTYNLISNAVKYTPAGGTVTVELRVRGGQLLFTVADTGCGIAPERLPRLFESYLYPERDMFARHGLGLGLPLCQCIAQAHGGQLLAESRPGQGSRISLIIPDCQPNADECVFREYPSEDIYGGFSPALLYLADALPDEAFQFFDD